MKTVALVTVGFVVLSARAPQSVVGCRGCDEVNWGYPESGLFNRYAIRETRTTPDGIRYDDSHEGTSAALIDRLTDEVERCMFDRFHERLSDAARLQSGCEDERVKTIDRASFVVKVASDYKLTCDGQQQVLPVVAPSAGCVAKDQTTTPECPCSYRAGIECPNILVVTPSLYIYKDVLIRFLYDCVDPWANKDLAACATPSTMPLSDGRTL